MSTAPINFSNFIFLTPHAPDLAGLGHLAERYSVDDANTALLKVRQFGELLAQTVAARSGLLSVPGEAQVELLSRLAREGVLPQAVQDLLHTIRKTGNRANHSFRGDQNEAVDQLRFAWIVGVWYVRTFADAAYRTPDFVWPLAQISPAELSQLLAEAELARRDAEQKLAEMQAQMEQGGAAQRSVIVQAAQSAAEKIELNEAQTRLLIDGQLRQAGWEADTISLRFSQGTRPEAGRNLAISEWPTESGPADYVLFLGLIPVATVEAKRKTKSVMGALEQAARYSRGLRLDVSPPLSLPAGPWEGGGRVPFVYATNGRPYLRQLRTESGIWFRDARRKVNASAPLRGWHTPAGLRAMLEQDTAAAEDALSAQPFGYDLKLRGYQQRAIRAAEEAIAGGQRELLLAMATGTGKTKTALALIYRALSAGRFRRVLFLVDREALGIQAGNDFKTTRLEQARTFADTFGLIELGSPPDVSGAVQVATVQGLSRRILWPGEGGPPPIDAFDLIVVDEAHRGYALDRDLADAELGWRSEGEYISKYRQVLEHFDAVKVALTATPALHTTEIFGLPVFAYSYREAVLDGVLVDHDAPTLIDTQLAQEGIHYKQGEQIPTYTPGDDAVKLYQAPDDIGLKLEDFNRRVDAQGFNRAVCEYLAAELNPFGPEKTLIFAASDAHADRVVLLLREALRERHGEIDEATVVKITGSSDRPQDLIRRYKNEVQPTIVVTVDLLTTGVDVPAITNLVFLRRVGSRILFEQMLGRATRRFQTEDYQKTVFRIYDAVRAYEAVQAFSTMQPVLTRPTHSFTELAQDFAAAPTLQAQAHLQEELAAKLGRIQARLTPVAHDTFEAATGFTPPEYVAHLRGLTPEAAAAFVTGHAEIMAVLDSGRTPGGQPMFISEHADQVIGVHQAYPQGQRPDDYLESFSAYLRENRDRLPALITVLSSPASLSRAELRKLALTLDSAGFSESHLHSAYRDVRQLDAAAGLMGYIRAAAAAEDPQPWAERVDRALKRILALHPWTTPQRTWLARIASKLKADQLLDRELFDEPGSPFRQQIGGYAGLDRLFGGQLPTLIRDLQEAVWAEA